MIGTTLREARRNKSKKKLKLEENNKFTEKFKYCEEHLKASLPGRVGLIRPLVQGGGPKFIKFWLTFAP